jgi:hypothetical protein
MLEKPVIRPHPNMLKNQKRNQELQSQCPASVRTTQPPPPEAIRQRAHEIYVAHGGGERMALNDWLAVEQELKRKLEG